MRVFARQGFHACRVSDIADEAGVAYGLVYHYFASKDEVLDTLFLERWNVMLELIREVDAEPHPGAREADGDRLVHRRQLPPRPGPDEGDHRRGHARGELVRQHAHRARSASAYDLIGEIITKAQADGRVHARRSNARFAAMAFYGAIEQLLTGWIFGLLPQGEEHFERAKWLVVETVCGGLRERARSTRRRAIDSRDDGERDGQATDVVRACWRASARSRASSPTALAAMVWRRVFDEEPPE